MSEIPEQLPYEQDPYQDMDDSRSAVSGAAARQIKSGYKLAIAGGTLIAFMAFIWIGGHSQTKSTAPEQPPDQSGQMPVPFEAAPLVIPTQHTAMAPVSSAPTPTVVAGADSPIFAFSTGSSTTAPQAPVAAPPDQVAQAVTPGAPIEANAANALTARLQSSATQPAMAELLPHPDMLITQGTIIPCTLQTAINSELPGYVKCVLPDDVRSTTGNVVLLDRGTIVIGEIQSGLQQGQNWAVLGCPAGSTRISGHASAAPLCLASFRAPFSLDPRFLRVREAAARHSTISAQMVNSCPTRRSVLRSVWGRR
jgi:type IV secretion system protein VirB10